MECIRKTGFTFIGGPLNGDYLDFGAEIAERFDMEQFDYHELLEHPLAESPVISGLTHRYERRFDNDLNRLAYFYIDDPAAETVEIPVEQLQLPA